MGAPSASPTAAPSGGTTPTSSPSGGSTPTPAPTPTVPATTPPTSAPTPTTAPTAQGVIDNPNASQINVLDDNPGRIDGNLAFFQATGSTTNTPIDGINCTGALPSLAQHFHDHLTLYVNGQQYALPAAIGIYHPKRLFYDNTHPNVAGWWNIDPNDPTACHYDIHVHAGDTVIHIETPSATQKFYLSNFLDIWGVKKSSTGFWKFTGPTRWFETNEYSYNPGHYRVIDITNVDPATIQLTPHVDFTVEVGTPLVNIQNYNFIDKGDL